ncbi:isoleucine--tRNA ligase, cytoplasmic-like protein, partial [Tanacetum coccineum]
AFRVVADDYVTATSGTGVVHLAPQFGEDDLRVCLKNHIINEGENLVMPVDDDGCFTERITRFSGRYIKDAEKDIIQAVKASINLSDQDKKYGEKRGLFVFGADGEKRGLVVFGADGEKRGLFVFGADGEKRGLVVFGADREKRGLFVFGAGGEKSGDLNAFGCLDWFLSDCKGGFPKIDGFANLVFTLFPVNFLNSFFNAAIANPFF